MKNHIYKTYMKKLIQTLLLLLIPGGIIFAQQTGSSQSGNSLMQKAQAETFRMNNDLHLTSDQITQVMKINVDYENQMDSYDKISPNLTQEEKQEVLKKINDKHSDALKGVLTIAQNEVYGKSHSGN